MSKVYSKICNKIIGKREMCHMCTKFISIFYPWTDASKAILGYGVVHSDFFTLFLVLNRNISDNTKQHFA